MLHLLARHADVSTSESPRSWVESAQAPDTDFPLANLPFGVFSQRGGSTRRVGVAIGDQILDVAACLDEGFFSGAAADAADLCRHPALNPLMGAGRSAVVALRTALVELLGSESKVVRNDPRRQRGTLVPMREAELHLPANIGDYTDFYASIAHATNVGKMLRPDNPLLPNYKWI